MPLDVVDGFVEIILRKEDDFLKVRETLTRMGVASKHKKTLYQSCHILHKKDKITRESRYYIVHFKELFILDGKSANFEENDIARRNTIVNMLEEWELVEIVDKNLTKDPVAPMYQIKILQFHDKSNWNLECKYNIGIKR